MFPIKCLKEVPRLLVPGTPVHRDNMLDEVNEIIMSNLTRSSIKAKAATATASKAIKTVTGQRGSPWKNRDLGSNAGKFRFFNK